MANSPSRRVIERKVLTSAFHPLRTFAQRQLSTHCSRYGDGSGYLSEARQTRSTGVDRPASDNGRFGAVDAVRVQLVCSIASISTNLANSRDNLASVPNRMRRLAHRLWPELISTQSSRVCFRPIADIGSVGDNARMTVEIFFRPAFEGQGENDSPELNLRALEAAKKHRQVIMALSVDGNTVDYGACHVMEYHTDLVEELGLLASMEDHDLRMSGYAVGSVRRLGSDELQVTLHTARGSATVTVPEVEFRNALEQAERRLRESL